MVITSSPFNGTWTCVTVYTNSIVLVEPLSHLTCTSINVSYTLIIILLSISFDFFWSPKLWNTCSCSRCLVKQGKKKLENWGGRGNLRSKKYIFLIGIVRGVESYWVHSALRPRVIMMEELVEWWLSGETEVLGENLSQCSLVHHKIHILPGRETRPPR
jgi:hypothetical protein